MVDIIPSSGQTMAQVAITVDGFTLDWQVARALAFSVASRDDEDPMLISWFDKTTGKFSPSCCKCDIKEGPAWEIYGKNHGGMLRISVNNDTYVFIYS